MIVRRKYKERMYLHAARYATKESDISFLRNVIYFSYHFIPIVFSLIKIMELISPGSKIFQSKFQCR